MMGSDKPYEVGRGKPPKHSQFKAGDVNNPAGKTSEQKRMEMENAARATRIQARLLEALEGVMLEDPTKERISAEFIRNEVLKLIKDAQDRGLGTPVQSVNVESPNGSMTPKPTVIKFIAPKVADESND